MRLFDCHSHWSTKRGSIFRSADEQARQKAIWGTEFAYQTEEEMTDTFRQNNARVILDLATTILYDHTIEEIEALHDYTFEQQRKNPDVIFGHWLSLSPHLGKAGVQEFHRAAAQNAGFVGFAIVGQTQNGFPASDPIWDPYYKASIDVDAPVLIHSGLTGIGQGHAGGLGIILDHGHPRHIDIVAARFPELKILAARPAYPWQDEMIAILLHKANVSYELHGWSPKAFSPALKREIGGRLQDRIMFGCDYPVLKYEMLIERWQGLGYTDAILEKVFHKNAERYFPNASL